MFGWLKLALTEMGAKSAKADQELFGEFSSSAYPEWRVAAERVLRGASLDTLEAKIWEGIKLQPIYHEGEQESLRGELDLGPVLRSGSDDPLWRISQELALPRPLTCLSPWSRIQQTLSAKVL